jgi:hypothetical protein
MEVDVIEGECKLLQGPFALVAQAVLAVLAFSTLLYKRSRENPKIELNIWCLNVSKQIISLAAAHIFAMLVAIFVSVKVHGASECSWYLVLFSVDTMVGTGLTYLLHRSVMKLSSLYISKVGQNLTQLRSICETLITCGYYGDPPSLRKWAWQALEWTLCVLIARFICAIIVFTLGTTVLVYISAFVDDLFGTHATLQLYTVMILYPLLMNSAQALIQDAILRAKSSMFSNYTRVYPIELQSS